MGLPSLSRRAEPIVSAAHFPLQIPSSSSWLPRRSSGLAGGPRQDRANRPRLELPKRYIRTRRTGSGEYCASWHGSADELVQYLASLLTPVLLRHSPLRHPFLSPWRCRRELARVLEHR